MACLMQACGAEKPIDSDRELLVRDPNVLGGRRLEGLHCSAAGNGRAAHQAGCWSSMGFLLKLEVAPHTFGARQAFT